MTRRRLALGAAGEALAARWYREHGYVVLAQNWRCARGEVDLILRAPDGTLVFSEVKTRSSTRYGTPVEAVTVDKQRRLRALAGEYLRREGERGARSRRSGLRFDVVSVLEGRIEVLRGAF